MRNKRTLVRINSVYGGINELLQLSIQSVGIFPEGPESDEFGLLKININKIEWRDSWEGETKTYEP